MPFGMVVIIAILITLVIAALLTFALQYAVGRKCFDCNRRTVERSVVTLDGKLRRLPHCSDCSTGKNEAKSHLREDNTFTANGWATQEQATS